MSFQSGHRSKRVRKLQLCGRLNKVGAVFSLSHSSRCLFDRLCATGTALSDTGSQEPRVTLGPAPLPRPAALLLTVDLAAAGHRRTFAMALLRSLLGACRVLSRTGDSQLSCLRPSAGLWNGGGTAAPPATLTDMPDDVLQRIFHYLPQLDGSHASRDPQAALPLHQQAHLPNAAPEVVRAHRPRFRQAGT